MPKLVITLEVPEGTMVSMGGDASIELLPDSEREPIEEYWTDFLSPNGRRLYRAAAEIEGTRGPGFSLEDIALHLRLDYESVKSYHRNSGRTATRWKREKGTQAPIRLVFDGNYGPQEGAGGWRSRYKLPERVAEEILARPTS
jgi:hypothetical protein